MSTYRSIALVSETLRHLLQKPAAEAVRGTTVRIGPPEEMPPSGSPLINIFLYTAHHTAFGRNLDEPTYQPHHPKPPDPNAADTSAANPNATDPKPADPPKVDRVHQPTAILELDYLFSFSGRKNTTDAEELLGITIRTLEMNPFLTERQTSPAVAVSGDRLRVDDMGYPAAVYPLNLDAQERARLWSLFFQIPYRLSTEYRVNAVAIPGDASRHTLPAVTEVHPHAAPLPPGATND